MKKCLLLIICIFANIDAVPPTTVGGTGPLYTVGFNNDDVYSVNLQTGTFTTIANIAGAFDLGSIVLIDRNTAYIGGQDTQTLYRMNLQDGSYTTVAEFPAGFLPVGIAILDETTVFLTGFDSAVYTFNQQTNQISLFTQIPDAAELYDIQILNDSTAYLTDDNQFGPGSLYSLDLKTGTANIVATFPQSVQLANLQLVNNTTAYVCGGSDANIYAVDLTTGVITLVTPTPVGTPSTNNALFGLALNDNTSTSRFSREVLRKWQLPCFL